MIKRLRWIATGVAVGVSGSVWAQRKMKAMASRYRPAGVAQGAATRAAEAWREGRVAMREREAELRANDVSPRSGSLGEPRSGRP